MTSFKLIGSVRRSLIGLIYFVYWLVHGLG